MTVSIESGVVTDLALNPYLLILSIIYDVVLIIIVGIKSIQYLLCSQFSYVLSYSSI